MEKIISKVGKKVNHYQKQQREFRKQAVKQMFTLSTAGFGLVAALAWNEAIKSLFKEYVDQYLQVGSGVISRFLYAVIVTALAVLVTYQLSKVAQKFEKEEK